MPPRPVQRIERVLISFVVIALLLTDAVPQSPIPQGNWTPKMEQSAELVVAKQVESIRTQDGLPRLKRSPATRELVQLVCTAAAKGSDVNEPKFGALETYVTDDLSAKTEPLKLIALGTADDAASGTRRRVFSDKDWPRYSVIVQLDLSSRPDAPRFRVGIVRRGSQFSEFIAPITFDHPVRDSNDWKELVAPQCRGLHSQSQN